MLTRNYFDVLTGDEHELNTLLTVTKVELRSNPNGSPQNKAERKSRGRINPKGTISLRYTFLEGIEGLPDDSAKVSEQAKLKQMLLEMRADRKSKEPSQDPVTVRYLLLSKGGSVEKIGPDVSEVHENLLEIKAVVNPLDETVMERSFPTLQQAAKAEKTRGKPAADGQEQQIWNSKKTRELFMTMKG